MNLIKKRIRGARFSNRRGNATVERGNWIFACVKSIYSNEHIPVALQHLLPVKVVLGVVMLVVECIDSIRIFKVLGETVVFDDDLRRPD